MKISQGIFVPFLLCQLFRIEIIVNSACLSTSASDHGCGEYNYGEDEGRRHSWEWGHRSKRSKKSSRVNISYNCTCGMRPQDQIKIVGGQLARDNAWPWVVPLVYTGDSEPWQFCGASIINSQYLLTAAHCAVEMKKKFRSYQAYLGTNSISGGNHVRAYISRIKTHYKFNSKTLENDIAVIKLSRPITFSEKVQPICLSQDANPYVGCSGVVTGWGSVRQGGKGVDRMREVKVKVLNNNDCARNYSAAKIKIAGGMMCAATPPKDSCQGDSGGPLFAWNSKSKAYSQIGIVSFGLSCGSQTYPGVYTRVSSYIGWIKEKTKDAYYCHKSF